MWTNDRYQTAIYVGLLSVWTVNIIAGADAAIVPNLCFTLDSNRPEFTLPTSPEFTLEN